jgi:hypothetical protein
MMMLMLLTLASPFRLLRGKDADVRISKQYR